MAMQGEEDAYATLLLSDTYLPGALVLAHSLRDAGTVKKLAVLVTVDSVSAEVIEQLRAVYDYVYSVTRRRNENTENLYLMNRPDLHSTFTKIELWKQTQFRKIVYIDSDVVATRAPDELFDLPHAFSAAPDIGWPDIFNTGLMVLTPNMGDYHALTAMADRSISFDGADQGLLNMYFKNDFNRLSFTYNVTPSANYQYIPAYRHFKSNISMVHFIGNEKPWLQGREASSGGGPFNELKTQWWSVYDRHYKQSGEEAQKAPEIVQYFVKGEYQPTIAYVVPTGEPQAEEAQHESGSNQGPSISVHAQTPQLTTPAHGSTTPKASPTVEPSRVIPQTVSWDASRAPPPPGSTPEAANFPNTRYQMSFSSKPFEAPARYPSPPRNMWYKIPETKPEPALEPKHVFPWEDNRPKPSRVFASDKPKLDLETATAASNTTDETAAAGTDASSTGTKSETQTPITPTIHITPSDPWASYTRANAWDDVPAIDKYIGKLPWHRRTPSQPDAESPRPVDEATPKNETTAAGTWRRRGSKLTDFPTAIERPSLPVTPAPIRRPKFWGGGTPGFDNEEEDEALPTADGVPPQSDWDPAAQLQLLAKQQSEVLVERLGRRGEKIDPEERHGSVAGIGIEGRELPARSLPFGSQDIVSPTFKPPQPGNVVSPRPMKPGNGSGTLLQKHEAEEEVFAGGSIQASGGFGGPSSSGIPKPSFQGPGAMFEKNEEYPTSARDALPTEEQQELFDA